MPVEGTDSLAAQVYIDAGCDGFFIAGQDTPLADVPVTLTFADGSSVTRESTSFGQVNFSGFDAGAGVTLSVELPATYRGDRLESCANSATSIDLAAGDFDFGQKSVQFRVKRVAEPAGSATPVATAERRRIVLPATATPRATDGPAGIVLPPTVTPAVGD